MTVQHDPHSPATPLDAGRLDVVASDTRETAFRRDRLLAAMVLITGMLLALALPFAFRSGAEFFLPVTAALVIAVALVPALEWLERRRVPSPLAALLCVLLFIALALFAVGSIVIPATDWFRRLPSRIGLIRDNLQPVVELYSSLQRFIDDTVKMVARTPAAARQTIVAETPTSLLDVVTSAAPFALVQVFFAILVIYFFLSGWTGMRRRTITSRGSFTSAMATARVIQEVVDRTSAYLATITLINISLGATVAGSLWLLGMPSPLMWGGIVALANYIPYFGPIASALLLALGGLMTFPDPWYALVPAAVFVSLHLVEANVLTPTLVGRRLTISPLLILVALSFWGWVWGTTGALLAVPLLIIMKTVIDAAGRPDIAGFLFEDGTLTKAAGDEPAPGRTGERPGGA